MSEIWELSLVCLFIYDSPILFSNRATSFCKLQFHLRKKSCGHKISFTDILKVHKYVAIYCSATFEVDLMVFIMKQ